MKVVVQALPKIPGLYITMETTKEGTVGKAFVF
jgi:hypothetical protein